MLLGVALNIGNFILEADKVSLGLGAFNISTAVLMLVMFVISAIRFYWGDNQ